MNSSDNSKNKLEQLNHTELYQLCQHAGLNVHSNLTREQLISVLVGELELPEGYASAHPIDQWRNGIIGFLNEHWAVLEPQIKCPAKNLRHPTNPNPKPCFGCLDTQVITCTVQNKQVEQLISAHRTRGAT